MFLPKRISKEPVQCVTVLAICAMLIMVVVSISTHQRPTDALCTNDPLPFGSNAGVYPCIAVLVEFRRTDRLVSVVHNVNYHIPSTWPIQIFHGRDNQDFIEQSTLAPLIKSGKVFLTLMEAVYDARKTNALLTDQTFWRRVHGEKILFFQIDSIMCSNSPHRVTDYLQYDYVGAPWNPVGFPFNKTHLVGNGGFSLRSREKILALLDVFPYHSFLPEDVWFAQNLHRVNGSIAPVDVAKTFAVEMIFYERPVGVHRFPGGCRFRRKIAQTCPEAVMVLPNGGC